MPMIPTTSGMNSSHSDSHWSLELKMLSIRHFDQEKLYRSWWRYVRKGSFSFRLFIVEQWAISMADDFTTTLQQRKDMESIKAGRLLLNCDKRYEANEYKRKEKKHWLHPECKGICILCWVGWYESINYCYPNMAVHIENTQCFYFKEYICVM